MREGLCPSVQGGGGLVGVAGRDASESRAGGTTVDGAGEALSVIATISPGAAEVMESKGLGGHFLRRGRVGEDGEVTSTSLFFRPMRRPDPIVGKRSREKARKKNLHI